MHPSRIDEGEWWRGRCPDGDRRFTSKDLLPPPPPGPRAEGRFNHFGQSVFYLSSAPEVASAETVPLGERCESVWIQEFRIAGLEGVLDLAGPEWWEEPGHPLLALALIERVRAPSPDRGRPWKPEYFVPRFVADCAKEAGFRAIRVESSRHEGTNLTLFDWSACRVDPIGAPQRMEPPQ
jgi:hypothetical protein